MRLERWVGALLVVVAALAALVFGVTRQAHDVYATPASPDGPGIQATGRKPVCQTVFMPSRTTFDTVAAAVVPLGDPAPVTVTVGTATDPKAATATYTPRSARTTRVPLRTRIAGGQQILVCFSIPRGSDPVGVYSTFGLRDMPLATQGGKENGARVALSFRDTRVSRIGELPTMIDRAVLFRARWLQPWMIWVLLGLVVVGVPALAAVAVRTSDPNPRSD